MNINQCLTSCEMEKYHSNNSSRAVSPSSGFTQSSPDYFSDEDLFDEDETRVSNLASRLGSSLNIKEMEKVLEIKNEQTTFSRWVLGHVIRPLPTSPSNDLRQSPAVVTVDTAASKVIKRGRASTPEMLEQLSGKRVKK